MICEHCGTGHGGGIQQALVGCRDVLKAQLASMTKRAEEDRALLAERDAEVARLRGRVRVLEEVDQAAYDALRAFDGHVHIDHVPKSVWDTIKRWYDVRKTLAATGAKPSANGDGLLRALGIDPSKEQGK